MKKPKSSFQFKEWHRTVILVLLLAFAIGFMIWSRSQYDANFIESF